MATASFGNFGYSGLVKRQRSRERIMPKSQQVSKIRQVLSNRGAGVDTLDLVDDWVDPTVSYEDNKREILRRVGFGTESRHGEREMVHEQCPTAIADCMENGLEECEFACEQCRDSPSCAKLALSGDLRTGEWISQKPIKKVKEVAKKKTVKAKTPSKSSLKITKTERVNLIGAPIYKISDHKGDWVKRMVEVPSHKCDKYFKNLLEVEGKGNVLRIEGSFYIKRRISPDTKKFEAWKEKEAKKTVKPIKTVKKAKATKKAKVTTKLKKPKPTPIAKSKLHEKILTDTQIKHARKHGYVNITIEGVKKRVSKRNFAPRKRTIYWYKSGGKVSLKVVRGQRHGKKENCSIL